MDSSSTSSSRPRLTGAFVLAILLIGAGEIAVAVGLPPNQGRHNVDELLGRLESPQPRRPVVIFGDSVTKGALVGTAVATRTNDLSSNQAIGVAGVYFTYKRYLERTPAPKSLVLVMIPESYVNDLDDAWTGTYFETCFLRLAEITDFARATGRQGQALRMAGNLMLTPPSYRSRGSVRAFARRLRTRVVGEVVLPEARSGRVVGDSLDRLLEARSAEPRFTMSDVSRAYLRKLVEETRTTGTRLVVVTGALPDRVAREWRRSGFLDQVRDELDGIARLGGHVSVDPVDQFAGYPDEAMWDGVHLEPLAKSRYGEALSARLMALMDN